MAYVRRLSDEEQRLPRVDLRVAAHPERWEMVGEPELWSEDRQPEWLEWVRVLALVLVPILVALIGAYFNLHAAH